MTRLLLLPLLLLLPIGAWSPGAEGAQDPADVQAPPALRILVSNDDGIEAAGLRAVVAALAPLGEVVVCAPDGNRSGASHSSTLFREGVVVRPVAVPGATAAWAASGTPSDAVSYGLLALGAERPFDLVVSGINHGANVGLVAHYSGTVGAAMEAGVHGTPAVAVSLGGRRSDFTAAAEITAAFVERLLAEGATPGIVYSLNFPKEERAALQGIGVGPVGPPWIQVVGFDEGRPPEEGEGVHYRARTARAETAPPGTDSAHYLAGRVSVTALRVDWSDAAELERLRSMDLALP